MNPVPTKKKLIKRGRPADPGLQHQRKQELLDAAFELLRHKSYRSISIRELADAAGTQSAMIKYYFGDKQGLFLALLEQIATKQLAAFQAVLSAPDPMKAFITTSLAFFAQNPPVVRLVIDEVLSGDSPLQQGFIELIPTRMARLLPQLINAQQQAGRLRQDLDPKWAAFSLVSLILTPFILAPVREQAWNIRNDEVSSSRWVDHIYRLFMEGVRV